MNIYDFRVKTMDGREIGLDSFQGKVLMIVNTASKCGFTPQLQELEELYQEYKDRGFVVLGFPCNQFHEQDPGSNEEIQEFCTRNYGVSFPLFAKTQVKGPDALPLFQYLVKEKGFRGFDEGHSLTGVLDDILAKDDPDYQDKPDIKWNFTKFVISRDGRVMARLEPTASPNSCSGLIESLLS